MGTTVTGQGSNVAARSVVERGDHLVDVGVVPCVLLTVLVQDLVSRPHHDGRSELHRPAARLLLAVAAGERTDPGRERTRIEERARPERSGSDDLGGVAVLVEEDGEWNTLVLDERRGVSLPAGPDGGDEGTCGEDLLVSIADLTGPLTAGQSAEVAQEQQDVGLLEPEVAEPVLGAVGIDENLVGELCSIERHGSPPWGRPMVRPLPVLAYLTLRRGRGLRRKLGPAGPTEGAYNRCDD